MKLFGRIVGAVLLLLVAALLAGFLYLRSSLPRINGEVALPGLAGPVEIIRDADAVPHIYAGSHADAVFGLGFAHAQDRLWQMEFQRRAGTGRLSEVIGSATLGTDKFIRTLGVKQAAESAVAAISPETRELLEAYVAGANAFLEQRRGALPVEFLLLGFEPEPFEVLDVAVWAKMMAWDLGSNWDDEILRAKLVAELRPADAGAMIELLWPAEDDEATVVVPPESAAHLPRVNWDDLLALAGPPKPDGYGSNNWVLAGEATASGKPILANDPHLSLQAPSLWYFAHLVAPGVDVIGATLPGTPAVLLGRTDHHAWGFTNTAADVQDLFLERVDPDDPDRYLTPDGSREFVVRREVIRVKGEPDEVLEVRETRHGPVISDVNAGARGAAEGPLAEGEETVVAFAWTALLAGDRTLDAVLGMNTATSWEEFKGALENFVAPMQNIIYADVNGTVAYHAPALVPVRRSGTGAFPTPGWTGEGDWVDFVPFGELPGVVQPESGRIVTANQRVVPRDYPHYLTRDWSAPYRAERINELLDAQGPATPEGSVSVQMDEVSLMAREFLPVALAAPAETSGARRLQDLMSGWDGEMRADSAAPLAFAAWYRQFARLLFDDALGAAAGDFFALRPGLVRGILAGTPDWCGGGCDAQAGAALDAAWSELTGAFGGNPSQWSWGAAHNAVHAHAILGATPLSRFANLKIPNGGDAYTPNAGSFGLKFGSFEQTHGPGYRSVYDLATGGGWFMHGTGQSGNLLSGRYGDYLERWRDGDMIPMRMSRREAEAGSIGTLRLVPGER